MTYRWAVMVTLAVLSSTGLPAAARAQATGPTVTDAAGAGDDEPAGGVSSPANRFAVIAAQAQMDLPQSNRGKKRSVLEPSGPRWLEDNASEPPQAATSPRTLTSDFASFAGGPGPEAMPEEVSPPAGDPTLDTGELMPADRTRLFDHLPHIGPARQPMMRDSWQFRPFNISVFEGALLVTAPIQSEFRNGAGFLTGFRVGWDFAAHFGGETRFGFSKIFLLDSTHSTEIGYEKLFYFDSSLLYYPLGDTQWRPFFSLGGGLADVNVVSSVGSNLHPTAFNMPFGGGIKYRYGSRVAFRVDIRDNLTFSGNGGLRTLNNIEILGGIEFHFGGGERRSYWPWNPSRHWW
jgi:hypothetical protein